MTAQKKKSVDRKRTPFPREIVYSDDFVDDWDKLESSGKHDMHRIKEAISLLIMNDGPLSAEWRDHKLKGALEGYRECHVKGDLLLVYKIRHKPSCEVVICTRIGTHSEVF